MNFWPTASAECQGARLIRHPSVSSDERLYLSLEAKLADDVIFQSISCQRSAWETGRSGVLIHQHVHPSLGIFIRRNLSSSGFCGWDLLPLESVSIQSSISIASGGIS